MSTIESAVQKMLKARRLNNEALEALGEADAELRQIIPRDDKRRLVRVSDWNGTTITERNFLVSCAADLSPVLDEVAEWEESVS